MMEGSGDGALQVLRRVHQEDFCQAIGLTSGEKYETQKPHHAQDMRQPKRVAAKILEELASSLEAAFEAAAIEWARVGLADDAHDLTQRIVRSTAKRKGVMRKAADLCAPLPPCASALGAPAVPKRVPKADRREVAKTLMSQ